MRKNNYRKMIGFVVITLVILIIIWYFYPKQIHKTYEGVSFQLGSENNELTQVDIEIEGVLKRSLTGNLKFKGTIDIEDEYIPIPIDKRELNINFNNNMGTINYHILHQGAPLSFSYGLIFINNNFEQFTIAKWSIDANDSSRGSWRMDNGLLITAPAKNRDEALEISNELMKYYLNGNVLK